MGKQKTKKAAFASINEKYANARLKKIDALMDQLRKQIGKKGDGQNGGSTSLIGAVEGLNNEAYDGKELTSAYSRFNKTTLPLIRNQISSLDMEFNVIDALAK